VLTVTALVPRVLVVGLLDVAVVVAVAVEAAPPALAV
jgi:hypothetical protein